MVLVVLIKCVDLTKDIMNCPREMPGREMSTKLGDITDPPDMVTNTIGFHVTSLKLFAGNGFAHLDGFKYRAVAEAGAADIVDFTAPWILEKMVKGIHQIVTVDVVSHLLAPVAVDAIFGSHDRTFHQP